jgi:O-succinylbenzoic acid--CoA ligase
VVEALESDRTRWAGLADIDTILVGGQALAADLRARASDLGLRIVRTYGSAETAGGVVYDGRPIGDTAIESVDGILQIASSSLALGYLNDEGRTAETFVTRGGRRWFRTTDVGTVVDGVVTVTGRADDIIISGGIKVSLAELERLVQTLDSTAHATWFAEPTWGQVPAVVSEHHLDRAAVRDLVEATLGKAARPYRFVVSPIPRLESGKPDRRELFAMVERATD